MRCRARSSNERIGSFEKKTSAPNGSIPRSAKPFALSSSVTVLRSRAITWRASRRLSNSPGSRNTRSDGASCAHASAVAAPSTCPRRMRSIVPVSSPVTPAKSHFTRTRPSVASSTSRPNAFASRAYADPSGMMVAKRSVCGSAEARPTVASTQRRINEQRRVTTLHFIANSDGDRRAEVARYGRLTRPAAAARCAGRAARRR